MPKTAQICDLQISDHFLLTYNIDLEAIHKGRTQKFANF